MTKLSATYIDSIGSCLSIDNKSMACYTEIILAKLQKSEEDTMNYKSVKISEDARIAKQSAITGDVTIGRDRVQYSGKLYGSCES